MTDPVTAEITFPEIDRPIYLSTGHTAHATLDSGIQRVTRSLARELLESGLRVELIEWLQRKKRYVVLDDHARRKLARNGGPAFESTEALWARVLPEVQPFLAQATQAQTGDEPCPPIYGEDRILRFVAVMRSIAHPIPDVPRWIGYLPLPRAGRRAIRRGIRRVINAGGRRRDRRRIRNYIRDIVAARRLHNRASQRILKLLEKRRDYAVRLARREQEAWLYKKIHDNMARAQDPDRLKTDEGAVEMQGSDRDLSSPNSTSDESRSDLFSLTHRLLHTRFRPIMGAWVVVPELMRADEMRGVVRYCRTHRLNLAVVFHDAIAVTHPDLVSAEIRRDYAAYIRHLCQGDLIISVSRQSADELREYANREGFKLPDITVCPNGASFPGERPVGVEPADDSPVRAICVGTIDPRKNHTTLLNALGLILKSHPSIDLQVTLIGNTYPGAENLAQTVTEACANNPNLKWIQGADDSDLIKAYRDCHFTVFPSVLEGFGIPVLESLWHGRPCICSATGAVGERASGGGCATVDVTNPDELAGAILRMATDLPYRQRLTSEANSRALRTWREQAVDLVAGLRQAVPHYQFANNQSDKT